MLLRKLITVSVGEAGVQFCALTLLSAQQGFEILGSTAGCREGPFHAAAFG